MKSITGQELLKAGVRNFGQPNKLPKIDDRDSVERMADELIKFTKIIGQASNEQASTITSMLKVLITAVEKISAPQPKAPEPKVVPAPPIVVDITNKGSKEWVMEVTERDLNGMIKSANIRTVEVSNGR